MNQASPLLSGEGPDGNLPSEASSTAIRIDRLGADGDGIADFGGVPLYLPMTLPGELVEPGPRFPRGQGQTADAVVIEASPHRVVPPCRHFGPCGGCTVQHMDDGYYAGWKRGLLAETVRRLGFTGDLPPLARTPSLARRRMDLAIRRENGAVRIGLHMRRSPSVVDMQECPVLHPTLFALVTALRPVLRSLTGLKREGSAVVNLLDDGPDLLLRTDAPLSSSDRSRLAQMAEVLSIPRISWSSNLRHDLPEPACNIRPALTTFSGRIAAIPSGAFLQASKEGEAAIQQAIVAALPKLRAKARIVELFAGCGSLTHALTDVGRVDAYEGDAAAILALRGARNPRVTAFHRDLARQPLQPADLKTAAVIVLDPPHGGAREQMPALAGTGVPIIYVTCNPAALLRDGRMLTDAGYRVTSAVGIDQFLWSSRVEGVVAFTR